MAGLKNVPGVVFPQISRPWIPLVPQLLGRLKQRQLLSPPRVAPFLGGPAATRTQSQQKVTCSQNQA